MDLLFPEVSGRERRLERGGRRLERGGRRLERGGRRLERRMKGIGFQM